MSGSDDELDDNELGDDGGNVDHPEDTDRGGNPVDRGVQNAAGRVESAADRKLSRMGEDRRRHHSEARKPPQAADRKHPKPDAPHRGAPSHPTTAATPPKSAKPGGSAGIRANPAAAATQGAASSASKQAGSSAAQQASKKATQAAAASGAKQAANTAGKGSIQGAVVGKAVDAVGSKALKTKPGEEDTGKGAAKDAIRSTASGAASGAVTAGPWGAAVGAVKGLGGSLAGNKRLRTGLIILLVPLLFLPAAIGVTLIAVSTTAMSGIGTAMEGVRVDSVASSQLDDHSIASAQDALGPDGGSIPWTIVLSANSRIGNSDEEQKEARKAQSQERQAAQSDYTEDAVESTPDTEDEGFNPWLADRDEGDFNPWTDATPGTEDTHEDSDEVGVDQDISSEAPEEVVEGVEEAVDEARKHLDRTSGEWDRQQSEAAKEIYGWDVYRFSQLVRTADPTGVFRDLANGSVHTPNSPDRARSVVNPTDGGDRQRFQEHEATRTLYTKALEVAGVGKGDASDIYEQALEWEMGTLSCATDASPALDTGEGSAGGDVDSLSPSQVTSARSIIGMSKGMFGSDWEHAAKIGIATSMREARLQVYANDGVYGTPAWELTHSDYPESAYKLLPRSLKLPHDAVGTDATSLGIFQQNLVGSWATLGNKTWENDTDNAIQRLMDPEFASFSFFRALEKVSGWKDLDPVEASHRVQGSQIPDGPRAHLKFAEEVVKKHSDAPKLTSPEGKVSEETGEVTPECGEADAEFAEVNGDFTIPVERKYQVINTYYGAASHQAGSVDIGGFASPAAPVGAPVYAIADGIARVPSPISGGAGTWVAVQHTPSFLSTYLHLSGVSVKDGEKVKVGQRIGSLGSTGNSTGPHLHMDLTRVDHPSKFYTPSKMLKFGPFMKSKGVDPGKCVSSPATCALAGM